MKKTLLLIAAIVVSGLTFAKPVSVDKARQVAVNFWNSTTQYSIDDINFRSIVTPNFQEISTELGLHGIYVFNTVDNNGFVIVSADDAVIPVLGYSTSNGIVGQTAMPENLKGWLNHYTEEIEAVQNAHAEATEEVAAMWNELVNGTVSPKAPGRKDVSALISTKWDQDTPYNNLCPTDGSGRSAVGCVATAMAQVMKYWEWPTTGTGSHSYTTETRHFSCSANFGSTTYDWSNMPVGGGYTAYSWNNTQKTAVSTLMYHCGVSIDMDYTYEGSGAYTSAVVSALRTYFGYAAGIQYKQKSYYNDNNWITLLKNELDAGRPMLYGGANSNGSSGHSFVCDGYNSNNQFHFNWGWSGSGDGFFALTSLAPGSGGVGGGDYIFTYYQEAVIGISSPNGNPPDNPQTTTTDLATYDNFTISSPVTAGSYITGSCQIANIGTEDFTGYLGVGAYRGSSLVTMLKQINLTSDPFESGYVITLSIRKVANSPLVAGSYTAKAVYSTDGTNWTPIEFGYQDCPTEVPFTITGGGNTNGINDVTESAVKLYPNPTDGILNVEVDGLQKVEVIDAVGRIVLSENDGNVDMSRLNNGVYSIRITADGKTAIKKVVKR
ncbi:MAG: thiol protease/hemagglutinin PrtT [Bacteroidales bacterium]|nr:thiol protease/hemagglutinin PrtT [Bacteroidales bacterium]